MRRKMMKSAGVDLVEINITPTCSTSCYHTELIFRILHHFALMVNVAHFE